VSIATDEQLRARQAASQRGFFRALAAGSHGSRLYETDGGVQATVAPARPWFSIFNTVVYEDASKLGAALPGLAEAYEGAGSKAWSVWVPPGDEEAPRVLGDFGLVPDSTPMLMAAEIDETDLDARRALDLHREPTWEMVARCNDLAHGVLEEWSMAAVVADMDDPATHLHVALDGGEVASALLAREHDRDCYFWFVATAPQARGSGLASELVRHALRDARERGCETTTLESTAMAEATYARIGFRALGRYCMWEHRAA
jgi:ribosomal protein S18 acetylase RimI-like enzyme